MFARQVARAEYRAGIVGKRRRHARTVRSGNQARNRSWVIALALFAAFTLLAMLASKATAEPLATPGPASVADSDADELHDVRDLVETASLDDAMVDEIPLEPEVLDAIAAGSIGALDDVELALDDDRHQRPSRFGRVDLSLTYRHHDRETVARTISIGDELWLLATWSR